MRRRLAPLAALVLPLLLSFCQDKSLNLVPLSNGAVDIRDDCDSVSFNAGLGAGTCTKAGGTTLAQFNTELTATGKVAAWAFVPSALTITQGSTITAFNSGGEQHTFTQVVAFGGGQNPALNTLAGTPVEAPECVNATLIAPQTSFTTNAVGGIGVAHYQCCIHPWMRADVAVVAQ